MEQFGDAALDVTTCVVRGLVRGQRSARAVQLAARAEGAGDNYAYGSMWNARYKKVVDLFQLADLPGFEIIKPKGASYRLAVVNGRVLIPFRHSDSLGKPIRQAKLGSLIPRRLSRESGVLPENTLFDELGGPPADAESVDESPSVGEAAAEARSLGLTVVYIGYVANSDSDEVLAAWWGTPVSLEDDGSMTWFPEQLDLSVAVEDSAGAVGTGLHVAGVSASTPGFAQGEEPRLAMDTRLRKDESPTSEVETDIPDPAAEDDE
ncbi:hypothetical protein ACIOD2_33840 [Amycolatopsis sp. NPDC088138]|uniref:hypothetical protein n=1 Tax=Amycolatopsis sp. NPDC088138 TaxID=3363938 RepID=UPI0037FE4B82